MLIYTCKKILGGQARQRILSNQKRAVRKEKKHMVCQFDPWDSVTQVQMEEACVIVQAFVQTIIRVALQIPTDLVSSDFLGSSTPYYT